VAEPKLLPRKIVPPDHNAPLSGGISRTRAAEHIDVPPSRISVLVSGRISTFTIDYLVNVGSRAGIGVNRSVGKAGAGRLARTAAD
jgi:hypothetical protein